MKTFWAKIDTINETSYETNTLSVLTEPGDRLTIRIDETIVLTPGDVYLFEAEPIVFKDKDQLLVKKYTHINHAELTLAEKEKRMRHFYPFAPVDMTEVQTRIEAVLSTLKNPPIKAITMDIYNRFKDAFYLYPAATKFHHAYIGGLAHHTDTMFKLSEGICQVYDYLNKDLLNAGILLHDIMKTVELSDYKTPEYTTEGRLIGHITMGVKEITKTAQTLHLYDTEERMLLEHIVLSHHYYGNFGSPKKPNIPEALALHYIDNIDSKFAVLKEALNSTAPGGFTSPQPILDREKFYKAKMKK